MIWERGDEGRVVGAVGLVKEILCDEPLYREKDDHMYLL